MKLIKHMIEYVKHKLKKTQATPQTSSERCAIVADFLPVAVGLSLNVPLWSEKQCVAILVCVYLHENTYSVPHFV